MGVSYRPLVAKRGDGDRCVLLYLLLPRAIARPIYKDTPVFIYRSPVISFYSDSLYKRRRPYKPQNGSAQL